MPGYETRVEVSKKLDARVRFPLSSETGSVASPHHRVSQAASFAMSSLAPVFAVIFTNPFDTAKVRLQLQGEHFALGNAKKSAPASATVYKNSFDCMLKTFRAEGARGLQKGLVPAMLREGSKNLFRLGLYAPVLGLLHPCTLEKKKNNTTPIWKMFLAGSISGIAGAIACNPFELVKTRLQSAATGVLASVGQQHEYRGVVHALQHIAKEEGVVKGWYRGATISAVRSTLGSGANLACYNAMRDLLVERYRYKDSALIDCFAGVCSGFASALLMNPVDVIRTRYFNNNEMYDNTKAPSKKGTGSLKEIMFVAKNTVRNEGPRALFKGFLPHFLRIGPHFALTFAFLGAMRRQLVSYFNNSDVKQISDAFLQNESSGGTVPSAGLARLMLWGALRNGVSDSLELRDRVHMEASRIAEEKHNLPTDYKTLVYAASDASRKLISELK